MTKNMMLILLAFIVVLVASYLMYFSKKHTSSAVDAEQKSLLAEEDKKMICIELNKAFADEWLAYYQYWIGAKVIIGPSVETVKKELIDHANDELRHAGMLADRILELGGSLLLNPKDWFEHTVCGFGEPKDPEAKAIIKQNLDGELCAVKGYKELADKLKEKDSTTYSMVLSILKDEEHHVKDLTEMLEKY